MSDQTLRTQDLRALLAVADPAAEARASTYTEAQLRAEAERIRRGTGTLELTVERTQSAQAQSPRRRSRRRVALTGGVAVVLLAAGGSAAAWVSATRPADPYGGFCAQTVTLDRDEWSLRGFAMAEAPNGTRALPDVLEICSQMWRTGMITQGVPNQSADEPVPDLTACVVEGMLVVFPAGPDTCRRLGVPEARQ